MKGKAYVFNCPYSTLCRQVVTDDEGRVAEFPFDSNFADVKVKVLTAKRLLYLLKKSN